MNRQIFITIVAIVFILLLGLVIVVWLGGQEARNTSPLGRQVHQVFLAPGEDVLITDTLYIDRLSQCPAGQAKPIDIILLIDRSGSMAGMPITQALQAARDFVNAADLSVTQIGIMFFNDAPTHSLPLSQDRVGMISFLQNVVGDGGTSADLALKQTREELTGARHRSQAQSMLILLSDGGSPTPPIAEQEARSAKQAGVHIVVIGIVGSGLNAPLLQSIASSSTDYHSVSDISTLAGLYTELAQATNRIRASQVLVTERYNQSAFDLVSGPADAQNQIVWNVGTLADQSKRLDYRLKPKALGWHDVSPEPGEIKLSDCNNQPVLFSSPQGPRVLVLAPWWLFLILLLLLPLLLLGAIVLPFLRKSPQADAQLPAPDPFKYDPKPPVTPWTQAVYSLQSGAPVLPSVYNQPALVVGLGEVGLYVLTALKKNLLDRFGQMPKDVRLLQIDVTTKGKEPMQFDLAGVTLAPIEKLTLVVDLDNVDISIKNNPNKYAHLAWWPRDVGDDRGRALGRMALFYDLRNDIGGSKLWRKIQERHPQKDCRLFMIASTADDVGSGAYLSLTDLIKRASQGLGTFTRAEALLSLHNVMPNEINPSDLETARAKTWATLRELARFSFKNKPVPSVYNPNGDQKIQANIQTALLDDWYLFGAEGPGFDLTGLEPPHGSLLAMADCLTMLVDPTLANKLKDYFPTLADPAGRIQQLTGEGIVGGMGSYVFQIATDDLRRACEYRLVYDVLFNPDTPNKVGIFKLARDPRGQWQLDAQAAHDIEANLNQAALKFLRDQELPNYHAFWGLVADVLEQQSWNETQVMRIIPIEPAAQDTYGKLAQLFQVCLQDQLNRILNGASPDLRVARSGKLAYTLAFLTQLRQMLNRAITLTTTNRSSFTNVSLHTFIIKALQDTLVKIDGTIQACDAWRNALIGAPTSRAPLAPNAARVTPAPSLFDLISTGLNNSRKNLAKLRQNKAHDYLLDDTLETPYYQANIATSQSGDLVARMFARCGWICDGRGDKMQIHLIVLPATFDGTIDPMTWALTATQVEHIRDAFFALATNFSGTLLMETVPLQFQAHNKNLDMVAELLAQRSVPPLEFSEMEAAELATLEGAGGVRAMRYLFAPGALGKELKKLIDDYVSNTYKSDNLRGETELIPSNDERFVAILGARNLIALSKLNYPDLQSAYYHDKLLHVFPAEQNATELEKRLDEIGKNRHSFHALFVRMLEDKELATQFAACWVYGFVRQDPAMGDTYHLTMPDGLNIDLESKTLFDAMESFTCNIQFDTTKGKYPSTHPLRLAQIEKTKERIAKALGEKRKEKKATRFKLVEERKKEIESLRESAEDDTHTITTKPWLDDLASFLALALEDEKAASA